MKDREITNIQAMRCTVKARFEKAFNDAQNLEDLLQAYAIYTGALEGILDAIECIEMAKEKR